jgi:hypothetical protein
MRVYFGVNLVLFVSFFVAKKLFAIAAITSGDDSREYLVSVPTVLNSTLRYAGWYVRDYPHVLTALGFLWILHVFENDKRRASDWLVVISLSWIVGSMAVMLPWHSLLLYYLLPTNIGAAMILGLGLRNIIGHLRHQNRLLVVVSRLALALFIPLAAVSCVNGFTHGRIQIAVDKSNAAMGNALASTVSRNDKALVYFPADTEYLFELWLHLLNLKHRGDIDIRAAHTAQSYLKGSDFFVVVPEIKNQPFPTVRIGMSESSARFWQEEVESVLADNWKLVSHISERVPLAIIALDKPILGLVLGEQRWESIFYYGKRSSWLDFEEFEYGWRVYRVSP